MEHLKRQKSLLFAEYVHTKDKEIQKEILREIKKVEQEMQLIEWNGLSKQQPLI